MKLGSYIKRNGCTVYEKVAWRSSNKKVATVDKNGKVTWKSNGTTKITAYIVDANGTQCQGSESTCSVTFNFI